MASERVILKSARNFWKNFGDNVYGNINIGTKVYKYVNGRKPMDDTFIFASAIADSAFYFDRS